MAEYFMVGFAGLAAPGFITGIPGLVAGDVLQNVFAVTAVATFPGDNVGSFYPAVPNGGTIYQATATNLSAATFIALVRRG